MRTLPLKANHKRIAAYQASLAEFAALTGLKHPEAKAALDELTRQVRHPFDPTESE